MEKARNYIDSEIFKHEVLKPTVFRKECVLEHSYVPEDILLFRDDAIKNLIYTYRNNIDKITNYLIKQASN